MTEETKLTVSREAIFTEASRFLTDECKVPTLGSLKGLFETPTSPSIAVYLAEWRNEKADEIAALSPSPAKLRAQNERYQIQIHDLATQLQALDSKWKAFNAFIQANHPFVISEWDSYGVDKE